MHREREGRARAPFVAVGYALVVMLAGSNLPTPLYPTYQRVFALSPLLVTLVYATYAFTVMPCLLVFGPLSDAVGRRPTLLAALAVAIGAAVLFAAAAAPAMLFAAQVLEGVAMGAVQGTAVPALVETEPSDDVERASLVGSTATVAGAAAGPLLAGVLAEFGPWPRRTPFLVETVLLAVALVLLLRLFPHDGGRGPWRPSRPSVPASIRRPFLLAGTTAFLAWAMASLFLSLVPSYVVEAVHTKNAAFIGGAAAAMLASSAVVQLVARRVPPWRSQATGLLLIVTAAGGLVAVAHFHSLPAVVATGLLAGAGLGLTFRGSLAAVNAIAPSDRKGDVVASYYLVVYLGTALPVVGVGAVAQTAGLLEAVRLFAYIVAGACVAALGLLRVTSRRDLGAHRSFP